MYSVVKRLEFCYAHRLLDYKGPCQHLHGHNAVAEIEIKADLLDSQSMVCDFNLIKERLKSWIDSNLDHKSILNSRDPLVKALRDMGEPVFEMNSNPTAETIARLIFDYAREQKLTVTSVRLWETPSACATYTSTPTT